MTATCSSSGNSSRASARRSSSIASTTAARRVASMSCNSRATSAGFNSLSRITCCSASWGPGLSMKSGTSDQSTMVTWLRWKGRRPASRRATSASSHSRPRVCRMATS